MKEKMKDYDLTEGIVWKRILAFAMPILFGILLQSLYTTVDAIIIGRYAGKEALAAIESVYTLTKLPVNFFVGLSSGATIIISQYYGAKKIEALSNACHTALIFAIIGGILLSLLSIFFSPFFINLLQVPREISDQALKYVIIYFSGMLALMVYNIGTGILRALGDSKTPFYFLIIANILNISLDLLFVAVLKQGVIGAGIATVISLYVCAILMFLFLIRTNMPCKIEPKKMVLHKIHLNEFIKLGMPVGIQSMLYPISNMIIQTSINAYGVDSIAAWAICGKLDFMVWFITDAFCTTIATFVAQNYGAQKYERAREGVRIGSIMALVLVVGVSGMLYLWHIPLGQLLVNDQGVITIMSQIMYFLAPLYVLYVIGAVLPGAIRGTGESLRPMFITLFGSCLCRILWILFIVPLRPSLLMVLGCYPVSWTITSLLYLLYYTNYIKKLNNQSARMIKL